MLMGQFQASSRQTIDSSETRFDAHQEATKHSLLNSRILNVEPKLVRDGAGFKTIPANIATFRVGVDGKLAFAHSYEIDTRQGTQFWSGMVALG